MAKEMIRSTGVGDSKTFNAPEGSFPDQPARDWSKLTCNGAPIPEHLWPHMAYDLTDQAWAEKNAGKEPARVTITRDEASNGVGRMREDLLRRAAEDQHAAYNPMTELAKQYVQPGDDHRFLSKSKLDAAGGSHPNFEIARKSTGEPVTYKNLVLGVRPKEFGDMRKKQERQKARSQMAAISGKSKNPAFEGAGLESERV